MSRNASFPDQPRTDWLLVLLLFAAGMLAAGQFAKIALTLGPLAGIYPGAGPLLPFVVSALSVMGILFGATAGMIVARLGVRVVLLTGMAAGAVLSALQAFLPAFPLLIALRLAEGAAHLAIVVSAPTLMAAVAASRDRSVVMGLWGTFFGVGFALAAFVAPALLALAGPAAVYLAHGAALVALAAVLAPRLPPAGVRVPESGGFLARHAAIYRTPHTVAPALMFFWHTLMFLGLLTYLPGFLGAWTAPVLPLIALAGTMGAGVLARTFAPHRIGFGGFLLTIGLMISLATAPEAAQIWIAVPLMLTLGMIPGAAFAQVPALNPDSADQARANGAIAQLGNLGTASSTPLFAATLSLGLAGPALLTAALAGLGIAAVWLIHRKIAPAP